MVYQIFRNKVDREDGFFREYTLCDADAVDVFIDPVVRLNISTVCVRQHEETGKRVLDLSMITWKKNRVDTPKVGERWSNF
jgi:hypothetical protein